MVKGLSFMGFSCKARTLAHSHPKRNTLIAFWQLTPPNPLHNATPMALTDYTTYAEIRGALGVSTTELPDSTLTQDQWATLLILNLEDVAAELPTLYGTISALPSGSRTTQQQRLYDLVRLFASYTTANTLLTSLSMFGVARLTDGRAEFQRVTDPFSDTRIGVTSMLAAIRKKLIAAYLALVPNGVVDTGSSVFTIAASIGLAVDPVTNA